MNGTPSSEQRQGVSAVLMERLRRGVCPILNLSTVELILFRHRMHGDALNLFQEVLRGVRLDAMQYLFDERKGARRMKESLLPKLTELEPLTRCLGEITEGQLDEPLADLFDGMDGCEPTED